MQKIVQAIGAKLQCSNKRKECKALDLNFLFFYERKTKNGGVTEM